MVQNLTRALLLLTFFCFITPPNSTYAFSLKNPERIGTGLNIGSSYDPHPTFTFAQFTISALYDYEQIMSHKAPDPLKFKIEGNIGAADPSGTRLLASFNFYALYYLKGLSTGPLHPYVEGGAGIAYSDFQVEGQGLRLNFNPQAGIGFEWHSNSGHNWYGALHAYHVSNGGLNSENRGINGFLFQFGYLF